MKQANIHILVLNDGDRTVAEANLAAIYGGDAPEIRPTTRSGSAARQPGDKADEMVGDNLAVARALRSLAAKLERQANGKMRNNESNKAHREQIRAAKAGVLAPVPTPTPQGYYAPPAWDFGYRPDHNGWK